MNKHRIRDMLWGFMFCAALVCSYYCGSSQSSPDGSVLGPANANASSLASSDYAVVGGYYDNYLAYVVVSKNTGKVVFSERVYNSALGTAGGSSISSDERDW